LTEIARDLLKPSAICGIGGRKVIKSKGSLIRWQRITEAKMTAEEKAIMEAAVEYTSYSAINRPSEASEKLYLAVNTYLASQKVGEIEEIKYYPLGNIEKIMCRPEKIVTGVELAEEIFNLECALNLVISAVNKLARGK
jgi:hypothetical protein